MPGSSRRRPVSTQPRDPYDFARVHRPPDSSSVWQKGPRKELGEGLSQKQIQDLFHLSDVFFPYLTVYTYIGVLWCDFGVWFLTLILFHSMDVVQYFGQLYSVDSWLPISIAVYFDEATLSYNKAGVEAYFKPFHRLGYTVVADACLWMFALCNFTSLYSANTWVPLAAALSSLFWLRRAYRRSSGQYERKRRQRSACEGWLVSERILEEQAANILCALCPAMEWDSKYLPLELQIARAEMLRCGSAACKQFIIDMLAKASTAKPLPVARCADGEAATLCQQWERLETTVSAGEIVLKLEVWDSLERKTAIKYLKQAMNAEKCFSQLILQVLGHEHGLDMHRALIEVDRRIVREEGTRPRLEPSPGHPQEHRSNDVQQGAEVAQPPSHPDDSGLNDSGSDARQDTFPDYPQGRLGQSSDKGEHLLSSSCDVTPTSESEVASASECICCFEQEAIIVFSKCRHLAYCKSCRNKALKRDFGPEWNSIRSFARRLRKPLRCPFCRLESKTVELSAFTGDVFAS